MSSSHERAKLKSVASPKPWTKERIEKLKLYRSQGKSIGTIAELMKTTKNAVQAKCNKLKLGAPPQPKRILPTLAIRNPVAMIDRTKSQCSAVLDLRDHRGIILMCGEPVHPGTDWCPHHYCLYHQPPRGTANGQTSYVY